MKKILFIHPWGNENLDYSKFFNLLERQGFSVDSIKLPIYSSADLQRLASSNRSIDESILEILIERCTFDSYDVIIGLSAGASAVLDLVKFNEINKNQTAIAIDPGLERLKAKIFSLIKYPYAPNFMRKLILEQFHRKNLSKEDLKNLVSIYKKAGKDFNPKDFIEISRSVIIIAGKTKRNIHPFKIAKNFAEQSGFIFNVTSDVPQEQNGKAFFAHSGTTDSLRLNPEEILSIILKVI